MCFPSTHRMINIAIECGFKYSGEENKLSAKSTFSGCHTISNDFSRDAQKNKNEENSIFFGDRSGNDLAVCLGSYQNNYEGRPKW